MKRPLIAVAFAALFLPVVAAPVSAQNLVQNPDFETLISPTACPNGLDETYKIWGWNNPTDATPDYFHECSTTILSGMSVPVVGVPANGAGNQPAHSGKAYAGIISYMVARGEYREYIQAPLTVTLTHGETYKVSFYVSLADESKWAIDSIGAYLGPQVSQHDVAPNAVESVLQLTPKFSNTGVISDKNGWTLVEKTFVADGTEAYIVIGNFKDDASTIKLGLGGTNEYAYYYIDDVSVVPTGSLQILKQVVNTLGITSGITTPTIFDMSYNCFPAGSAPGPNAVNVQVSPGAAGLTIADIGSDNQCKVQEAALAPIPNLTACQRVNSPVAGDASWVTTYMPAQTVGVTANQTAAVTVTNVLTCDRPTSLRIWKTLESPAGMPAMSDAPFAQFTVLQFRVNVTCALAGVQIINQTVTLNIVGPGEAVSSIPVGSDCTVTEQMQTLPVPPPLPAPYTNCAWQAPIVQFDSGPFSNGDTITNMQQRPAIGDLPQGSEHVLVVINKLACM